MFAYINPDKTIFCISGTSLKKKLISEGYSKDILDEEGNVISTQNIEPIFEDDPVFADLLEVDFDDSIITNPVFDSKSKKIIQLVTDAEKLAEKKKAKFEQFISAQSLDSFDWEGIELSGDDYNHLIILRNFEGDSGSQMAKSMKKDIKDIYVMVTFLGLAKEIAKQVYADEIALAFALKESRQALGLSVSAFDLSFLD